MKVVLLLSLLALGCNDHGVDCTTLGAPAAPRITATFATAVAATFTVDGSASAASCGDVDHGTTCATWIIELGNLADGTHTLAASVPGQAIRRETFALVDVKDGCGAQAAQPDRFSL
jgi:hypothetical protein